jgi:transcriptional regulator with XRE-family HTH domain
MARGALNWSGRELAAAAGLAYNTISAFERGSYAIRDSSLERIRQTFVKNGVSFKATNGHLVVSLEKVKQQ